MVDVLIVFGSKSDFSVYEKVFNFFKEKGVQAELKTISAHREPAKLKEVISETDAKIIIAGAGLSAALPGVIASLTETPVVGIPVSGNFAGLDAFLSIAQMPSGKPVLAVGPDQAINASEYAKKLLEGDFKKIVMIKRDNCEPIVKAMGKAETVLKEAGIEFEVSNKVEYKEDNAIYLDFLQFEKLNQVNPEGKTVFFIPCRIDSRAEDALKIMQLASQGLWVGLNRGDNAALIAVKLLKRGK